MIVPPVDGEQIDIGTPPTTSQVRSLKVSKGVVANTAVVECDVGVDLTSGTLKIYRSLTNSFSSALAVQALTGTVGHKSWTDADVSIADKAVYYWVVYSSTSSGSTTYGPVSISFASSIPAEAPEFDASHDAAVDGVVKVNCVVTTKAANKRSTRVWISGYQGVAAELAIHDDEALAFSFNVEQTGEAVTLKAAIIGSNGTIGDKAVLAIVLGPNATAPARPLIKSSALFKYGIQIVALAGTEALLSSHRLYRAARGGGFGAAALFAEVPYTTEGEIVLVDPVADAVSYEWYVTAVNSVGESVPSDAVYDASAY